MFLLESQVQNNNRNLSFYLPENYMEKGDKDMSKRKKY